MIRISGLEFGFGERIIFSQASFVVNTGEKVALIGSNGSGKTTLFKILTYQQSADEGNIEINESIDYVPQEIKSDPVMDHAFSLRSYINQFQTFPDYLINQTLAGLDLKVSLDQNPRTLSGGQKTRMAIARALLTQPDILLLDEPTNFLDVSGKQWLTDFLSKYTKTLILISHDVDMLDRHIDKVLHINPHTHQIDVYNGNYSQFLKLKKEKEDNLLKQVRKQQKQLVEMKKGFVKIAGARSEKGVRQKLNIQHRIEKMEDSLPEIPPETKSIKLNLPDPVWVGEMPLFVKNINKSFGSKAVLTNVNFDIKRGERISLSGANGTGKSTFIKIIMGLIEPDSGLINLDSKAKIGYYSQEFEQVDPEMTLIDFLREKSHLEDSRLRSILAKMLFTGNKIYQKISTLSGGEKTRLSIAALLTQSFNLLILDEPTTYLDPLSQRLILESLKSYEGAMIIVSHTPEFIDELNPPRIFELPAAKYKLTTSQL
jgi:ATP-binding cassette, subfamily F, member 3